MDYKRLGKFLLIASIVTLLFGEADIIELLFGFIFFPDFPSILQGIVSITLLPLNLYGKILFFAVPLVDVVIRVWAIVISIILIKRNAYSKQLLWFTYVIVYFYFLKFIVYLPQQQYMIVDLIVSIVLYIFLIKKKNVYSNLIKNKQEGQNPTSL